MKQNTRFAVGIQSAKGTAATTNFHRGIMLASRLGEPDFTEQGADEIEHSGAHSRTTGAQGTPVRTGFVVPFSGRMHLYPTLIGDLLIGLGFTPADPSGSGAITHAFTLANNNALRWISVMQALGPAGSRFERKARDGRLTRMQIQSNRQGITVDFNGMALNEAASAGTETVTAETNLAMTQAGGSFTITSSNITANAIGIPRASAIVFDNPLEDDDQAMASFARADLAPSNLGITGTFTGLEFAGQPYRELNWGGNSGTGPTANIPEAQLTWKYQTAVNIAGQEVPHSLQIDIAVAQVMMRMADVEGGGKYIYDMAWRMLDRVSTAPITITLINSTTGYAGS